MGLHDIFFSGDHQSQTREHVFYFALEPEEFREGPVFESCYSLI